MGGRIGQRLTLKRIRGDQRKVPNKEHSIQFIPFYEVWVINSNCRRNSF